ncbi:endo-1,3(4)-beta-glucanase [Phlegmacium glaucopus]|nr:endo-1,3(4)-beta-glucanase [Phlegmacium glaucopus]
MKVIQSLPLLMSLLVLSGSSASAYSYRLSENIVGQDFYQKFNWEAIADPTHGRVNYVDQQTSIDQNLTYASHNAFVLRTDYYNQLDPYGPGRNSVRIQSKKVYRDHVVIFDLRHMPQGCGTWPAIWEVGQATWPQGGEVDILEGVNDQGTNAATLHTTDGCTMPDDRTQTGTSALLDCNTEINDNRGCSVSFAAANSYGPSFNANGGGWYAMERSDAGISMWFWPRSGSWVPDDVKGNSNSVNPQNWKTPSASFPNTYCDFGSHFDEQNIIINLTLCGDWAGAGNVYSQSGCPSTCDDFVNYNPDAFVDAYFEFASVRVFT